MKVAVYSTHILWPTHHETDLEIMQTLLDEGCNVTNMFCNGKLRSCELINEIILNNGDTTYNEQQAASCSICVAKRKKGYELLNKKTNITEFIDDFWIAKTKDLTIEEHYFSSHNNFKTLYYDNYDIGWSILSSYISNTQNPNISLQEFKSYILNSYKDCVAIYLKTIEDIQKNNYEKIYVFNGRLSYTKAIFRAAQKCGVDCYISERGSNIQKYSLFKNHTIHNIEKFKENALLLWNENKNEQEKEKIAHEFFANRRKGIVGSWHSMTELQKEGFLPQGWNKQNTNIVFFTSSDDEFSSIDDSWNNPYFETQLDAIKYVKQIVEQDNFKGWKLYVRVHPNAQRLGEDYIKQIQELESNTTHIIHPTSPISSYALIDACDVAMSVGSTIGYEAVYAGKYTIQLGKSLYYSFQGPINPNKKEDIASLLLSKKNIVPPKDILILGYFMNTYGIKYKYYKPDTYMSGIYNNFDLNTVKKPDLPFKTRLKIKLKKLLH